LIDIEALLKLKQARNLADNNLFGGLRVKMGAYLPGRDVFIGTNTWLAETFTTPRLHVCQEPGIWLKTSAPRSVQINLV